MNFNNKLIESEQHQMRLSKMSVTEVMNQKKTKQNLQSKTKTIE